MTGPYRGPNTIATVKTIADSIAALEARLHLVIVDTTAATNDSIALIRAAIAALQIRYEVDSAATPGLIAEQVEDSLAVVQTAVGAKTDTTRFKADSLARDASIGAKTDSIDFNDFKSEMYDSLAAMGGGGIWSEDYWPLVLDSVNKDFDAIATDKNYQSIIVPTLATGATIRAVYVLLRGYLFTSATAPYVESLSGNQQIRVKKNSGTWDVDDLDGILFATGSLILKAYGSGSTGVCAEFDIVGGLDVKAEVDGAGTYDVQWEDARCLASIYARCDAGLRIVYQQ